MHNSIKSDQKRPKQYDAPYHAQKRPKTTKTKRRPIRRPKATKNDQIRNDAQNDAQEQDDTLSLARISTTAQMARSLAYRDGSMAHLFAYRRRLKWLARSQFATAQWLTCSHIDDGSNGSIARILRRLNGALVRISTTAQMDRSLAYQHQHQHQHQPHFALLKVSE